MPEWYEACQYCGKEIDFAAAAIVVGDTPIYQPFMEDWRGGYVKVAHPKCFAEAEGVDALLEAVAREDARRVGRLGS
jgi:hypothetical protein